MTLLTLDGLLPLAEGLMENSRPDAPDSSLDEIISQIPTMREVTMHLSAAAITTLSDSPNDDVHRRRFVHLAERVMKQAVSVGLVESFRVQCDGENNSGLGGTECFRVHLFYKKPGAEWSSMELVLGEDDWFIIDNDQINLPGKQQ
jgi:hypothetical protein